MKALAILSLIFGSSLAQASPDFEIAPPTLIEQSFHQSTEVSDFAHSLEGTLIVKLSSYYDLQEVGLSIQLEDNKPLMHISRNESGNLILNFDEGFSTDLKDIEVTEDEGHIIQIAVKFWNIFTHNEGQIKARSFTKEEQSSWVSFASPLCPLAVYNEPSNIPVFLNQNDHVASIKSWLDLIFKETIAKAPANALISMEVGYTFGNPQVTFPVVLIPAMPFDSELSEQLDARLQYWLHSMQASTDHGRLVFNIRIFVPSASSDQSPRLIYFNSGLELPLVNLTL